MDKILSPSFSTDVSEPRFHLLTSPPQACGEKRHTNVLKLERERETLTETAQPPPPGNGKQAPERWERWMKRPTVPSLHVWDLEFVVAGLATCIYQGLNRPPEYQECCCYIPSFLLWHTPMLDAARLCISLMGTIHGWKDPAL